MKKISGFERRPGGMAGPRHLMLAVMLAVVTAAGSTRAQETPRFLMSDVLQIVGRCDEDSILVRTRDLRGVRLDLTTGKQVSTPPLDVGWDRTVAMGEDVRCSPDGRWAFDVYSPFIFGDAECVGLPTVALWDTTNGKHYIVGRGDWDIQWAPERSMAVYRLGACSRERDRGVRFALPPPIKEVRVVALRDIVRRALGPNSGWNVDTPIRHFTWIDPDHILVHLGSHRKTDRSNGVIVVVEMKDGVGIEAEQVNPPRFRSSKKLAVEQASTDRSEDTLVAAGCNILGQYEAYEQSLLCGIGTPRRWHDDIIRVDLERYCASLTAGDVEQFCRSVPRDTRWHRLVIGDRVLLLKGSVWGPDPPAPDRRSDLFLIENDVEGYVKPASLPASPARRRQ